jgi:hypothetical protein
MLFLKISIMTIQLDLPIEIETELSQLSKGSKQAMKSYIIEAVRHQLQHYNVKNQESILLKRINLGFSDLFWTRHQLLIEKKVAETINQVELEELIDMTTQVESANAQRIEAAFQLAILRNKNPKELMKEIGIYQKTA